MGIFQHLFNFSTKSSPQKRPKPQGFSKTFILEPILTPSAGVIDDDIDIPPPPDIETYTESNPGDFNEPLDLGFPIANSFLDYEEVPFFEEGVFTVEPTGQVSVEFLYDGGSYYGEVAIFSLEGLDSEDPDFMRIAMERALSSSDLGHVVITDATDAARFSGSLGEGDWNSGTLQPERNFAMRPGDRFGIMLIPNGTVKEALDALNANLNYEDKRPLFSLGTANPLDGFHVGQIADVTGDGNVFVMEDQRFDTGSDKDYNDIIFQVRGAVGKAALIDDLIDPERDWRNEPLGQEIVDYAKSQTIGKLPDAPEHPAVMPPTIPLTDIDTGSNDIDEATVLRPSETVDIIDQVSNIDPLDVFKVNSEVLNNTDFSVLEGEVSVTYVNSSGEVLATQVLERGNHKLQVPTNAPEDITIKIESSNGTPATYMLYGFESTTPEPFKIDLEFDSSLTASQQQILEAAARNVASLIEQGLPTAIVDGKLIDDINIKISTANLDGVDGTQARTKIDFMRYGSLLPAQSLVQLDAADIAELEKSGNLFDVAQHEFLHALGFGNLWAAKGLINYADTPLAQYNGKNAVKEFQKAGGLTDSIALETEGNGSASLHWHQQLFPNEMMTADLNGFTGEAAPISAVTIASLADLGYVVNLDQATPGYQLFGSQAFDGEDLTPEQIEAFRQLAEMSFEDADADYEYIAPIMPTVDPDKVAPEIWAHAERFWKNNEYYDWVDYRIQSGDTLSHLASRYLGSPGYDYYMWIANRNKIPNANYIVTGDWIQVPIHHPDYEWKMEQQRLQREAELKKKQEEEAKKKKEQEEKLKQEAEQKKLKELEEKLKQEAEAKQKQLEEQERKLAAEQERKRQQEEWEKEQARLREIERQKGLGGQDWYLATPLPEFGPVDPFETRLTGETVGNLVPDDYYRFTLSRGGRITAELRRLLADADLVLYDVRNRPIAYSMREGITDEHIIADLIPGTYMLRVNSPKGVTTDYELIVKFKHLLSRTEQGPPPGWQVGGSNSGSSGGSIPPGATFADPRIEKIFKQAVADFATPERQKAKSKVDALKYERDRLEREKKALIASKSAELRGKVHGMLDRVKSDQQKNVNGIANNIKGGIDGAANRAIKSINGLVPDWVFNIPFAGGWLRDRFNEAKGPIEGAIHGARNWLKAKVDEVKNTINNAISWFIDQVKNAYFTAGEANIAIEGIAARFRGMIENAIAVLNGLLGTFKGMILGPLEWTRNIGVKGWNLYDNAIVGLVNSLTNGAQDTIRNTGRFFMDRVGDAEKGVQWVIAEIGNLLGDETGRIYNQYQDQIRSLNNQIEAITNETENRIKAKEKDFQNRISAFLDAIKKQSGDLAGNVLDFLWGTIQGEFNDTPTIWQTLLDTVIGVIPIVGEIGDVRDLIAYTKKFVEKPEERQKPSNWLGVAGALIGLAPVVGGVLKGVTKIAKNGSQAVVELRKLGQTVVDSVVDFVKKTDWKALTEQSISFFIKSLKSVEGFLEALANGAQSLRKLADDIGGSLLAQSRKSLDNLQQFASKQLDEIRKLLKEAPGKIRKAFEEDLIPALDWMVSKEATKKIEGDEKNDNPEMAPALP